MKYRVSAVDLRRWNNFSGDAFRSRSVLTIKLKGNSPIQKQEQSDRVILQQFKNLTAESDLESKYYLESNNWNLSKALSSWEQDNLVPDSKPAFFSKNLSNAEITQAGPIAVVGETVTYFFSDNIVQAEAEILDKSPSTAASTPYPIHLTNILRA